VLPRSSPRLTACASAGFDVKTDRVRSTSGSDTVSTMAHEERQRRVRRSCIAGDSSGPGRSAEHWLEEWL